MEMDEKKASADNDAQKEKLRSKMEEVQRKSWSMGSMMKNVIHFMLVVFLYTIGMMDCLLTGMVLASILAGFVIKTKPEKLDEKQTIICKGFIYLTIKTFAFAVLTGLVMLL